MESPQSLENLQPFGCPNFIKKSGHLLGGPSPAEEGRPLEAPPAEVFAEVAIRQHPVHGVRQADGVVRIHLERRITDHLGERGGVRRHYRRAARHGLQNGEPKALTQRRERVYSSRSLDSAVYPRKVTAAPSPRVSTRSWRARA